MRAAIEKYLNLGRKIEAARNLFFYFEEDDLKDGGQIIRELDDDAKGSLKDNIVEMIEMCEALELKVASRVLASAKEDIPQNGRE